MLDLLNFAREIVLRIRQGFGLIRCALSADYTRRIMETYQDKPREFLWADALGSLFGAGLLAALLVLAVA